MQERGRIVYENVTNAPAKQEEKGKWRTKKGEKEDAKKQDEWQMATPLRCNHGGIGFSVGRDLRVPPCRLAELRGQGNA